MLDFLLKEVKEASDSEKAKVLARFFKTGEGEYGNGDIFCGLTVPQSRKIAQKYHEVSFEAVDRLLKSKIHEERLIAVLILVAKFQKGDVLSQKEIFDFYLSHTNSINNWDLVDLSADKIVGEYLYEAGKGDVLVRLAHSQNLWERRIAMISTFTFIKNGQAEIPLRIADILLNDKHDLIQKAVGWMLREAGKRISEKVLEAYLKTRYQSMPRTALRYAIEKFPQEKRKKYLQGKI